MTKYLIKNNLGEGEFMWSQFKRTVYDSWESTVAEHGAAGNTVHRARKQGWVRAGVRHASYLSFRQDSKLWNGVTYIEGRCSTNSNWV